MVILVNAAAAFDFAPRSSPRDQLMSQLSSHTDGQAKMQRALAEANNNGPTFSMCPPRHLRHAVHNRRSPDVTQRSFRMHDNNTNNFSAGNGPAHFARLDNTRNPANFNCNFPMGPGPMGHDFAPPSFVHGPSEPPFHPEMNAPTGFMPFPPNMGPMMPPYGMPWSSPQLPPAPGPHAILPGVPMMPGKATRRASHAVCMYL